MATAAESFDRALHYYQAGALEQAEWFCRSLLQRQSDHAEAWHLLGAIAHQRGDLATAVKAYQQTIACSPDHAEAQSNCGIALQAQGQISAALLCLQRAVALQPTSAVFHYNLGNGYLAAEDWPAAIAAFRQALALQPSVGIHLNLGLALRCQGDLAAATLEFRRAFALEPDHPQVRNNLANILQEQRQFSEAIAHYEVALTRQPGQPDIHYNLANALKEVLRLEEAVQHYRQALRGKPQSPEIYNNLGVALQDLSQPDLAIECYRQAAQLNPGLVDAHVNWGHALQELGDHRGAIAAFDRALALQPDHTLAHMGRGAARLLLGDFAGLPEYSQHFWQWLQGRSPSPPLAQPCWQGEDLAGQTLLLHHRNDLGYGDTIQFIRHIPQVAACGAQVVLECDAALARLFAKFPGVTELVIRGEPLPEFQIYAPVMFLPWLTATTLTTIPTTIPYLAPPPDRMPLPTVTNAVLKVGLVWGGSERERSLARQRTCGLLPLLPLLTDPSLATVAFYSLQKGARSAEIGQLGLTDRLVDLQHQLTDFAETAAVIAQLDLVITIDTAVAHLGGALGCPVWLMLPYTPDWRWLLQQEDTPWYPTMRLFRQPAPGDWPSVIAAVIHALQERLAQPELTTSG